MDLVQFLMLIVILVNVTPSLAEQMPTNVAGNVSEWAVGTLIEGERLVNYPLEWYDDSFQQVITEEKLEVLVEGTARKLSELELEINENFEPVAATGNSREAVVISLYNTLAKYQLPAIFEVDHLSPVEYMVKRGIIKGTSLGLELARPCSTEQAVIIATRLILDTYQGLSQGSKGFMWKTTKNNNTVYMLGSIHIGDPKMYPFSTTIKDAYDRSDTLVIEANIMNQQAVLSDFVQRAMYSDGTTLKDHISEETYQKCLIVFEQFSLPAEAMGRFKPWSVANDLNVLAMTNSGETNEAVSAVNMGIDVYFLTKATLENKPIIELEGLVFQADLFNSMAAQTQERYLLQVLNSILNPETDQSSSGQLLANWQTQWHDGNLTEFKNGYLSLQKEETEISKMLFGKRDQSMAEKIKVMLEATGSRTYFVVVGAGHFIVNNSVIDLLIDDGYEVEVIK